MHKSAIHQSVLILNTAINNTTWQGEDYVIASTGVSFLGNLYSLMKTLMLMDNSFLKNHNLIVFSFIES